MACGYVGGVDRAAVEALRTAAGRHAARMAVGTAFVAKGRIRAGNPVPGTALACEVLCGISDEEAARHVDRAFEDLPDSPSEPAYDTLQNRLEAALTTAPSATGDTR